MALNWFLNLLQSILLGGLIDDTSTEPDGGDGKHKAYFRMPLHYPRYVKSDYEEMEEWRVDALLQQYGIEFDAGSLEEKRRFAMGAFLWPDQF